MFRITYLILSFLMMIGVTFAGEKYCFNCQANFLCQAILEIVMNVVKLLLEQIYGCMSCNFTFPNESHYKMHPYSQVTFVRGRRVTRNSFNFWTILSNQECELIGNIIATKIVISGDMISQREDSNESCDQASANQRRAMLRRRSIIHNQPSSLHHRTLMRPRTDQTQIPINMPTALHCQQTFSLKHGFYVQRNAK